MTILHKRACSSTSWANDDICAHMGSSWAQKTVFLKTQSDHRLCQLQLLLRDNPKLVVVASLFEIQSRTNSTRRKRLRQSLRVCVIHTKSRYTTLILYSWIWLIRSEKRHRRLYWKGLTVVAGSHQGCVKRGIVVWGLDFRRKQPHFPGQTANSFLDKFWNWLPQN